MVLARQYSERIGWLRYKTYGLISKKYRESAPSVIKGYQGEHKKETRIYEMNTASGKARLKWGLTNLVYQKLNIKIEGVTGDNIGKLLELCGNVQYLGLKFNNIGDAGAMAIAASPYLLNLTYLNLCFNNIDVGGVIAIATNLKNLRWLYLWNNNISNAGIEAIKAICPFLWPS